MLDIPEMIGRKTSSLVSAVQGMRAPSETVTGPSVWFTESPLVPPGRESLRYDRNVQEESFQPEKKNKTYL